MEEDVLLAEEGEEQPESKDGNQERDEARVHEAHEQLESYECLFCWVVKGEADNDAVSFLLDGDLVGVLALALPAHPPDQDRPLQVEHK